MATPTARVHLVGSMPFRTGEELFDWLPGHLRDEVRRVPDETGERAGWVTLQLPLLMNNPALEPVPPAPDAPVPMPLSALRDGETADSLDLGMFAYGPAAARSYELFRVARERGDLRGDAKLLVAMPAPMNPVGLFCHPRSHQEILVAYERSLRASVDQILTAVPHEDLAIQWDLVSELGPLGSGARYGSGKWGREDVEDEIALLASWIPEDVELGFHLCFGDTNRDNIHPGVPSPIKLEGARPDDATPLREAANTLTRVAGRPIAFVHMAIPVGWTDDAQFAPLQGVELGDETELYLGVVNPQDGLEAARRRRDLAAGRLTRPFGVATECGMGRYGTEQKFATAIATLKALAAEAAPS